MWSSSLTLAAESQPKPRRTRSLQSGIMRSISSWSRYAAFCKILDCNHIAYFWSSFCFFLYLSQSKQLRGFFLRERGACSQAFRRQSRRCCEFAGDVAQCSCSCTCNNRLRDCCGFSSSKYLRISWIALMRSHSTSLTWKGLQTQET